MTRYLMVAALAVAFSSALAVDRYNITAIQPFGNDQLASAYSVSDNGKVAVNSMYAGNDPNLPNFPRGFIWSGGVSTLIPAAPGNPQTGTIRSVNNGGQAVGTIEWGGTRSYFYNGSAVSMLPAANGGSPRQGFDINNSGQVAGGVRMSNGTFQAFRWSSATNTTVFIGSFSGTDSAFGFEINDGGKILGYDDSGIGGSWLYTGGVDGFGDPEIVQLDDEVNSQRINYRTLNNSNEFVGEILDDDGKARTFLRKGDGSLIALNPLPAEDGIYATAINEKEQIVGQSGSPRERNNSFGFNGTLGTNPFLWDSGTRYDLNSLVDTPGYTLLSAMDINENGWIVGSALDLSTGRTIAYLATPAQAVPEPATMAALGLGALALVRKRRAAKK